SRSMAATTCGCRCPTTPARAEKSIWRRPSRVHSSALSARSTGAPLTDLHGRASTRWPRACQPAGAETGMLAMSGANRGPVDAQPVAVRDLGDLFVVETRACQCRYHFAQMFNPGEPVRRWRLAGTDLRSRSEIDAPRPVAFAHPVQVALGGVMAAVGADADMVDAGNIDRASDQLAPFVDC